MSNTSRDAYLYSLQEPDSYMPRTRKEKRDPPAWKEKQILLNKGVVPETELDRRQRLAKDSEIEKGYLAGKGIDF